MVRLFFSGAERFGTEVKNKYLSNRDILFSYEYRDNYKSFLYIFIKEQIECNSFLQDSDGGGQIPSFYLNGKNRLLSYMNDTNRAEKLSEVKKLIYIYGR